MAIRAGRFVTAISYETAVKLVKQLLPKIPSAATVSYCDGGGLFSP
jgi:hypothetical protein